MPTYVYECAKCGDEFELWQSFSEEALKKHPGCGGKVTKVLQPVGIVLKGSGFYKNDSRSGNRSGRPKKSDATSERSGDKSSSGSDSGSNGSDASGSSGSSDSSSKSDSAKSSDSANKSSSDKKPSTPASKST